MRNSDQLDLPSLKATKTYSIISREEMES